jgi:hypothetical protein
MESIHIQFDNAKAFDEAVHGGLAQASPISIITKHGGTVEGKAIAVVTFDVSVDGQIKRAQATTTVKLLRTALYAFLGAYNDEGVPEKRA